MRLLKTKYKIILLALLILGTLSQSLTMVRSGLLYPFGMGFWGPNGHDGIWHLSLINQVLKGFPPPHPTFAGEVLTNYHDLFDLILALIQKITGLSAVNLYFQISPIILSFFLGLMSFLIGYWWRKNFWTGFWLAFLNYFAGSFGYLVTFWREGQLGGESLFWSMQSISTLINPPFALSLIVILVGMGFLLKTGKWTLGKIILVSVLFGLLINIKAYAGVIGLAALGFFALVKFLKKEKIYLGIFGLAFLVSLVSFVPVNQNAGSLFVFQPFWFVHSMIESPDRLYLPSLALARYFLIEKGIGPRLIVLEMGGLVLFLIGNLGTRIIALWDLVKNIRKLNEFDLFLISGGMIGFIIPMLFVQKGTSWNTIQFFYYFLFFVNFYAAATLTNLTTRFNFFKFLLLVFLILLTIPTSVSTLKGYLGWPAPATIPPGELEALKFLEKQPQATVLTYPYDPYLKINQKISAPVPLYAYETNAYVSAFSQKQTYLEDEMNLEISGYNWSERRKKVEKFFQAEDQFKARGFLLDNKIGYIYLVGEQKFNFGVLDLGLRSIYEKNGVRIYQVL